MPYIKKEDRIKYKSGLDALVKSLTNTAETDTISVFPGHLNYIITTLIKRGYESAAEKDGFKLGYSDYNEIVGMLECAKLEFARRTLFPYEDKKIEENGDIE